MKHSGICNAFSNLTFILFNFKLNGIAALNEETQEITGYFAFLNYYTLGKINCKLIAAPNIGTQFKNGTYTGGLKLLNEKKGDYVHYLTSYFVQSSILDFSFPVLSEKYVVSHKLNDFASFKNNTDILKLFKIDPFYVLFVSIIVLTFIGFLFVLLKANLKNFVKFHHSIMESKLNDSYKIINYYFKKTFISISPFKIYSICFVFYSIFVLLCFSMLLISNSFLTSKVLIDIDDILYDKNQLLKSKRYICFTQDGDANVQIRNSYENSFLNILYKKSLNKECIFELERPDLQRKKLLDFNKDGYLIESITYINVFIKFLIEQTGYSYWISKEFFSLNLGNIIRKSLDESTKKALRNYGHYYLEFGIYYFSFRSTANLSRSFTVLSKIYESLEEVINSHTTFVSNDLQSFHYLFVLFFGSNILLLLHFIFFKLLSKRIVKLIRAIYYYLNYLHNHLYQTIFKLKLMIERLIFNE